MDKAAYAGLAATVLDLQRIFSTDYQGYADTDFNIGAESRLGEGINLSNRIQSTLRNPNLVPYLTPSVLTSTLLQ
jgi:hypothetical protein